MRCCGNAFESCPEAPTGNALCMHWVRCGGCAVGHRRDASNIRLRKSCVNIAFSARPSHQRAANRAIADVVPRAGVVNARRPGRRPGRSEAKSIDEAEHGATLECAMDGGLSADAAGGLRAALHDEHMPRLKPNEKCRQNPRVIHSASPVACARLRAADRGNVGPATHRHRQRPRRRTRDGVNDPPIAHGARCACAAWGRSRHRLCCTHAVAHRCRAA